MKLTGLVLAAGLSSRMGALKPLMRIGGKNGKNGKTLLEHSVDSLLRGGAQTVIVVLGFRAGEIKAALAGAYPPDQVRFALNPAFERTDMLASIKIGISALPACDAFFLLPGDMPAVDAGTLEKLAGALERTNASVAIPTVDGHRKHPPLIRSSFGGNILSYNGEGGLRGVWRAYGGPIADVPVNDEGCLLDADRMDDFLRLSKYMEQKSILGQAAPARPQA